MLVNCSKPPMGERASFRSAITEGLRRICKAEGTASVRRRTLSPHQNESRRTEKPGLDGRCKRDGRVSLRNYDPSLRYGSLPVWGDRRIDRLWLPTRIPGTG